MTVITTPSVSATLCCEYVRKYKYLRGSTYIRDHYHSEIIKGELSLRRVMCVVRDD